MTTTNQQKQQPPYPIDIDFDEASKAWMRNKKRIGEGMYAYVCGAPRQKHLGSCKRNPENVQRRKKAMRMPGYYRVEFDGQVTGSLPWQRCIAHRNVPL